MDSGMNSIESMYLNYSGLLEEFSEDVIRSRYAFLLYRKDRLRRSLELKKARTEAGTTSRR